jgi:hypothetical protein
MSPNKKVAVCSFAFNAFDFSFLHFQHPDIRSRMSGQCAAVRRRAVQAGQASTRTAFEKSHSFFKLEPEATEQLWFGQLTTGFYF